MNNLKQIIFQVMCSVICCQKLHFNSKRLNLQWSPSTVKWFYRQNLIIGDTEKTLLKHIFSLLFIQRSAVLLCSIQLVFVLCIFFPSFEIPWVQSTRSWRKRNSKNFSISLSLLSLNFREDFSTAVKNIIFSKFYLLPSVGSRYIYRFSKMQIISSKVTLRSKVWIHVLVI